MELEALGPEARRRVIRAVRDGTAVEDPEEAAAAVTLAREVLAVAPDERALWLRLLLGLLVALPLIAFWWLGEGFSLVRVVIPLAVVTGMALAGAWRAPLRGRRRRERAARAERLNLWVAGQQD
jgi:hypothetical protein